jgi:hypothetical protein
MEKSEEHEQRECEEEKDQIRTEYQEVLENSVAFEKRIRNQWRRRANRRTRGSPNSKRGSRS